MVRERDNAPLCAFEVWHDAAVFELGHKCRKLRMADRAESL